ncbi:hypothetical protein BH11CYA1_BH11CYA1_25630 [soil metagenome]
MTNTLRYIIAAALLAVAVIAVVCIKQFSGPSSTVTLPNGTTMVTTAVTVSGYYGGEKEEFLNDAEVRQVLLNKYGITINAKKAGSVTMVRDTPLTAADDFLWPSSQVSLAIYKQRGGVVAASDNIFNSPMVMYTWTEVADFMIKANVVQKRGDIYYITDMPKLVKMISDGAKWKDVGFDKLGANARVGIRTSDPRFSNSGFIFAGLLASTLNGGDIPDDTTIDTVMPRMASVFTRLGFMEQSSKDLFQGYLTRGMGAYPMIAGYESQLVEYILQNPGSKDEILRTRRVLYSEPTVWSNHPFIARTANGKRLLEALKDPEIQEIAWKKHGFRSGLPNVVNDIKALGISDMPKTIDNVVEMPSPSVMEKILTGLDAVAPAQKP